jgi:hypothetical protein
MTPKLRLLVAAMVLLGITTCCAGFLRQPGTFATEPVKAPVLAVAARHDAYVTESTMTDSELLQALEESAQLVLGLASERATQAWFEQALEPVATRHDAWVTEDAELMPYQRRTFLRSTEILRGFYRTPQ